uniref:Dipeptidase n=1 Tax=Culicoides sonorensis TaxID=179676 RepID=A0A336KBF7_CULSO
MHFIVTLNSEMANTDLIPHAPPPPLSRKLSFNAHLPSYNNTMNRQNVFHQQPTNNANTKNKLNTTNNNKRVETNGGLVGGQQQSHTHQLLNNKPDLFNFSITQPSVTSQCMTTSTASTTKPDNNKKKLLINDDGTDINMKPYPPFYFDDNHLPPPPHHCPASVNVPNSVAANKENELFFYHHEPANYIPNNYDQFGGWNTAASQQGGLGMQGPHSGKYNTIGSHHSINSKFHTSTCNLHDTNLLAGHHFSTSLSNFHNSQTLPHPYHQFHSGALGLGYGGSSLIGGSFNSNGSLGDKRGASWKHRSNCPSRNSSSSGTNSGKWDLPSRQWLAVTSILLITAAAGVAVPLALRVSAGAPLEERLEVATQLLESVPLIDGHNDLPWNIRKFLHNKLNDFQFDGDLKQIKPWSVSQWSHTDLQRMKKGRLSAQFWAAYAPCEAQFKDAVQITIEQIDVIKRLTEQYAPQLTACTTALHITEAHKNHQICSLIGLEGGHTLGGSLGVLRIYYELGVRYMTLTSSSCHTTWADSHNADAPKYDVKHGGLTKYGKTIIREMNRLGMIIDLSKSAVSTMKDVLQLSEAPVIFSHSSAFDLCNSSRNVQNEIIQMVAKKRGIIMVNFYSKFLTCSDNSTVHDAVAHINHIKRIAGVDFVGLGAGFDGINMVPQGLEDISTYPLLFAELLGTGWTVDELTKLAGENLLRVMTEVEQIRDIQRKSGIKPFEEIPPIRTDTDPYNCTTGS